MNTTLALLLAITVSQSAIAQNPADTNKIRVIVFGAHPDDCDITAGGLAALYVSLGHAVKFVSLTMAIKAIRLWEARPWQAGG